MIAVESARPFSRDAITGFTSQERLAQSIANIVEARPRFPTLHDLGITGEALVISVDESPVEILSVVARSDMFRSGGAGIIADGALIRRFAVARVNVIRYVFDNDVLAAPRGTKEGRYNRGSNRLRLIVEAPLDVPPFGEADLFQIGQNLGQPRRMMLARTARWKHVVSVVERMNGQCRLLHVVRALHPPRCLPCRLDRGKQQRDEDADDRDDDE